MEALLLTLEAVLMVCLLISVRRCENRSDRPDLSFFSYTEDAVVKTSQGQGAEGDPHRIGGPHA